MNRCPTNLTSIVCRNIFYANTSNLGNVGNSIADLNYLVGTNGYVSIYIYDSDDNVNHLNG